MENLVCNAINLDVIGYFLDVIALMFIKKH